MFSLGEFIPQQPLSQTRSIETAAPRRVRVGFLSEAQTSLTQFGRSDLDSAGSVIIVIVVMLQPLFVVVAAVVVAELSFVIDSDCKSITTRTSYFFLAPRELLMYFFCCLT